MSRPVLLDEVVSVEERYGLAAIDQLSTHPAGCAERCNGGPDVVGDPAVQQHGPPALPLCRELPVTPARHRASTGGRLSPGTGNRGAAGTTPDFCESSRQEAMMMSQRVVALAATAVAVGTFAAPVGASATADDSGPRVEASDDWIVVIPPGGIPDGEVPFVTYGPDGVVWAADGVDFGGADVAAETGSSALNGGVPSDSGQEVSAAAAKSPLCSQYLPETVSFPSSVQVRGYSSQTCSNVIQHRVSVRLEYAFNSSGPYSYYGWTASSYGSNGQSRTAYQTKRCIGGTNYYWREAAFGRAQGLDGTWFTGPTTWNSSRRHYCPNS